MSDFCYFLLLLFSYAATWRNIDVYRPIGRVSQQFSRGMASIRCRSVSDNIIGRRSGKSERSVRLMDGAINECSSRRAGHLMKLLRR